MANKPIASFVGIRPQAGTEKIQFAMHPRYADSLWYQKNLCYTFENTALYRDSSLGNKALVERRCGGDIALPIRQRLGFSGIPLRDWDIFTFRAGIRWQRLIAVFDFHAWDHVFHDCILN